MIRTLKQTPTPTDTPMHSHYSEKNAMIFENSILKFVFASLACGFTFRDKPIQYPARYVVRCLSAYVPLSGC